MGSTMSTALSVSSGLMLLSLQGTAKVPFAQGTSPGSLRQGGTAVHPVAGFMVLLVYANICVMCEPLNYKCYEDRGMPFLLMAAS